VSHANLRLRDPEFVDRVDRDFAEKAYAAVGSKAPDSARPTPPMFTPFKLRDIQLDNRVVVSPMCQYSAKDGTIDDWHLVHLGSRAVGGAGLVMAEMTDVSAEGRISPGCAGMYEPHHVPAWRRVTEFVHAHSRAKIGLQLGHAGRKASTQVLWQRSDMPLPEGNWPILAPSPIPYRDQNQVPREMTREDMDAVLADHVRAAEMAQEAGFDILELHMAHGYLLSTFLSPITNRRSDEYGGSIEARMKYPLEVFAAIRKAWPDHKPLSVRLSATDWVRGGQSAEDSVAVARALQESGCDIIDVSTGQVVAEQRPRYGRLYQTPYAEQIRLEVGMPTMAVGNISTSEDVNSVLAGGRADLVAIARAHLWNPYWTRHAAYAQDYALPWPDPYATMHRYTPRDP
jgi:anthraniloyl-CoA monooxygenase